MIVAKRFLSRLCRLVRSSTQGEASHHTGRPYPTDENLLELLAGIGSCAGCEIRELSGVVDMSLEDLKDALAAAAAEDLVDIWEAKLTLLTLFRPQVYVYLAQKGHAYLLEQGPQTTYSIRTDIEPSNGGIAPPEGISL